MLTQQRYNKKIVLFRLAVLIMVQIFFVTSLCCAEPFVDDISLSNRNYLRTHLLGNSDKGKSRLKDELALISLAQLGESDTNIKILIKAKINEILGSPQGETLTINKLNQLKEHFDKLSPGQKNTFTKAFWKIVSSAADIHMKHERLVPQSSIQPPILISAVSNALDLVVTFAQAPDGKLEISNIEQMDAGGKAINVAKGLSKFGAKVKITGFKGHGKMGKEFIRFLDNYGLYADFIETGADTRVSLFFIDKKGDFEIRYRSPGETILQEEVFGFFDQFLEFLKDAETGQFLITGGRIPPGIDYSVFSWVIRVARKKGLKVVFDFSDTLTQKDMKSILEAHPYLIKPDLEEFAKVIGKDESELRGNYELIAQEAKKLARDYNVEIVLVSMDKDGAILVKDDLVLLAVPPQIEPLSTVGAGDALITGLVYKLNSGASIEEALRFAVATGTATCLKPGTKIADLEEANRLFDHVTAKILDIDLYSTGAPHFRMTSDILEIEIPREWDSSMTRAVARFKPELIKEAIRDALLNKEGGFIQDIILKLGLNGGQIKSIKILPAQEGPYYGVFRGDIMLNTGEVTHFGLNIVLNNSLNEDLEKDYQNLNLLHSLQDKLGLKYVPQTYALGIGRFLDKMGEPVEMRLFAVEWLGGGGFTPELRSFTELHRDRLINKDKFYLLPNYMQGKLSKSYAPLDNRETIYIRKQIISLLASIFAASFEEDNGGLVIKRTSINNGDFMVRKNKDSSFDICIITARDLGRMSPAEFIDYLLEHEHAEFIEINMPKSGGIAESSVKTFRFYEDRSEIEEGVIDGLAKVYGYEKALHLAKTWFKDSGLYNNDGVIAQTRQINPTGANPERIGQVKALRKDI